MPAGDLVTGPWQFELQGLKFGDGTAFNIERRSGAVTGLVGTSIRLPETDYAHADGSFIGEVTEGPRTAVFSIEVEGADGDAAGTSFMSLRAAFGKTSATVPLYFNLPGWGKRYVNGRPAGVVEDMRTADFGLIYADCSFRITDPVIRT